MTDLLQAVSHHGYLLLFLIVFAESCGLPAPAALALVAAGSAAAMHVLHADAVFATAIAAMLMGDIGLFLLGRYTGWAFLGLICSISLNPETCILRSAESFYKHGRVTLLFIKFIPGVNTMAAPLAGSMKMKFAQFLQLDFVGGSLYIAAYAGVGYIFRDFVARITHGLQTGSRTIGAFFILALLVFIAYRCVQFFRLRIYGAPPKAGVEEIALRLASEGNKDLLIVDVRSHGYYDAGTQRIAGSIRFEPGQLANELKALPHNKDIYVYCT
ncbi:MAG: VTT domain-containing protein [Terriglobales bacterium]